MDDDIPNYMCDGYMCFNTYDKKYQRGKHIVQFCSEDCYARWLYRKRCKLRKYSKKAEKYKNVKDKKQKYDMYVSRVLELESYKL